MAETDDSAAVNLMLLNELRLLEVRANALSEFGVEVEQRRAIEDGAMLEYKALKAYLAAREKEFAGHRPEGVDDWVAAMFATALRKAHIAMAAPTSTRPKSNTWRSAVHGVCEELSWHVEAMTKGLKL